MACGATLVERPANIPAPHSIAASPEDMRNSLPPHLAGIAAGATGLQPGSSEETVPGPSQGSPSVPQESPSVPQELSHPLIKQVSAQYQANRPVPPDQPVQQAQEAPQASPQAASLPPHLSAPPVDPNVATLSVRPDNPPPATPLTPVVPLTPVGGSQPPPPPHLPPTLPPPTEGQYPSATAPSIGSPDIAPVDGDSSSALGEFKAAKRVAPNGDLQSGGGIGDSNTSAGGARSVGSEVPGMIGAPVLPPESHSLTPSAPSDSPKVAVPAPHTRPESENRRIDAGKAESELKGTAGIGIDAPHVTEQTLNAVNALFEKAKSEPSFMGISEPLVKEPPVQPEALAHTQTPTPPPLDVSDGGNSLSGQPSPEIKGLSDAPKPSDADESSFDSPPHSVLPHLGHESSGSVPNSPDADLSGTQVHESFVPHSDLPPPPKGLIPKEEDFAALIKRPVSMGPIPNGVHGPSFSLDSPQAQSETPVSGSGEQGKKRGLLKGFGKPKNKGSQGAPAGLIGQVPSPTGDISALPGAPSLSPAVSSLPSATPIAPFAGMDPAKQDEELIAPLAEAHSAPPVVGQPSSFAPPPPLGQVSPPPPSSFAPSPPHGQASPPAPHLNAPLPDAGLPTPGLSKPAPHLDQTAASASTAPLPPSGLPPSGLPPAPAGLVVPPAIPPTVGQDGGTTTFGLPGVEAQGFTAVAPKATDGEPFSVLEKHRIRDANRKKIIGAGSAAAAVLVVVAVILANSGGGATKNISASSSTTMNMTTQTTQSPTTSSQPTQTTLPVTPTTAPVGGGFVTYTDPSGAFTAQFPGQPTVTSGKTIVVLPLLSTTYSATSGGYNYSVIQIPLISTMYGPGSNPYLNLLGVVNGQVSAVPGSTMSVQPTYGLVGGYYTAEFEVDQPNGQVEIGKAIIDVGTVYVVAVSGPSSGSPPPNIQQFANGFQILGTPQPTGSPGSGPGGVATTTVPAQTTPSTLAP